MDDTNEYLEDITKALELIAKLQEVSDDKSSIAKKLDSLNKLIREDYIKLNNQFNFNQPMDFYQDLLALYNQLVEKVKFPAIANKKIIAIGGRRNVGKSKFINSLLSTDNLPTAIKATTTIPTYISFASKEKITTYNLFGSQIEIDKQALKAITCEFYNKYGLSFTKIIERIIVQMSDFEYANLVLLDTPGYKKDDIDTSLDSVLNLNQSELQKSDYLLWLLDIEQKNLLAEDIKLINQLDLSVPVFVVINKADKKDITEVEKVVSSVKNELKDLNKQLIGFSAYSTVAGKEVLANNLRDFLAEANQEVTEVTVLNQFSSLFKQINDFHNKRLDKTKDKYKQLAKLIEGNESIEDPDFIKCLLDDIKTEIKLEQDFLQQSEALKQQILDKVKDILAEVKISFFDYQERGYKLLEAIKEENFELAERLIDLGVDLEVKDKQGQTPLVVAVKKEAKDIIEQLLIAGAKFVYQGEEIIETPIPGEGSKENPYIIFALSGLEKIGTADYPLDAHYKLGSNIDASPTQNKDYNAGQGWQPIGETKQLNDYQAFMGSFDGAGYQIKNLYCNRPEELQIGFFRVVGPGGVVKNLDLVGAEICGQIEVGGVAGRVRLGEIVACSFSGIVRGEQRVGQIVGKNEGGKIKSVSSQGQTVGNIEIGGLIGYNNYYGLLKNSFSSSQVNGKKKVGGVIGQNDQGGQIESSYAEGDVSGESLVGGLSGYNYGSTKNSFANGDVSGHYQVGGLIGKSESKLGFGRAEIIECYASGHISGGKVLGGLVGENKELIKDSYATGTLEGSSILGGLAGSNSGVIEKSYVSGKGIINHKSSKLVGRSLKGEVIDSYWKKRN